MAAFVMSSNGRQKLLQNFDFTKKMSDTTKEKLFLYDDNSSSVADPQIAKRSIEIFTQLGIKLICDSIWP